MLWGDKNNGHHDEGMTEMIVCFRKNKENREGGSQEAEGRRSENAGKEKVSAFDDGRRS